MAVSLSKGGNVSLSKEAPGLTSIVVGLGWDPRATDGQAFDLDGSVFLLNAGGKVRGDSDFIFYNNKTSSDGSVAYRPRCSLARASARWVATTGTTNTAPASSRAAASTAIGFAGARRHVRQRRPNALIGRAVTGRCCRKASRSAASAFAVA